MTKRDKATNGVCKSRLVNTEAVERARTSLPAAEGLAVTADAFKVLGHPARLSIIEGLDGHELCVCDLSVLLGLSMAATSQHLRELRRLGAIQYRASGKFAYYRVADTFWLNLARSVMKQLDSNTAQERRMKKVV